MDSYLLGQITIESLEDWLVINLQKILDSGDQDCIALANNLDADVVELNEGLITTALIRERLQNYILNRQTILIEYGQILSVDEGEFVAASSEASTVVTKLPIPYYSGGRVSLPRGICLTWGK